MTDPAYVMKPLLCCPISIGNLLLAITNTQRAHALKLLGARSSMRLKDFSAHRIGPETRARLVRDGIVVRPARGLYQLADGAVDAAEHWSKQRRSCPKASSAWCLRCSSIG